jgi:hypothetical protein
MGDLFVRAAVVAVRIPKLKGGKWRNGNVEVALATGVLSEVQRRVLIALLQDRIAGSARKRHADLCLMPKIRTHRGHSRARGPLSQQRNSVGSASFPPAWLKRQILPNEAADTRGRVPNVHPAARQRRSCRADLRADDDLLRRVNPPTHGARLRRLTAAQHTRGMSRRSRPTTSCHRRTAQR